MKSNNLTNALNRKEMKQKNNEVNNNYILKPLTIFVIDGTFEAPQPAAVCY